MPSFGNFLLPLQSDSQTYADLCAKDLDGVTCELPFRGVTRFWDNNVTHYQVHEVRRARCALIQGVSLLLNEGGRIAKPHNRTQHSIREGKMS